MSVAHCRKIFRGKFVKSKMGEHIADALRNLSNDSAGLMQYWQTHQSIAQQSADVLDVALRSLSPVSQPLAYLLVL